MQKTKMQRKGDGAAASHGKGEARAEMARHKDAADRSGGTEVQTAAPPRRYFSETDSADEMRDAGGTPVRSLRYCAGGEWLDSKSEKPPMECRNPSTGDVIALAPQCTREEVERTIAAAADAYPAWAATPVNRRAQVLFRMKALVDRHLDELTHLLCREEGKKWEEAMGDVLKVNEVVEFAAGAPHLMKGEALMGVSTGYNTTLYHRPVGVFAGIAPWNFPAMIPHGWMTPICVAAGNCMILKAASFVPQSAMRLTELWQEAGIPPGVISVITAGRKEAEILLTDPRIAGVSFVGSTAVGQHIYATAAANGKRVQALTEAKNHALVLRDCNLPRTVQGIINAFCGCAGERCMALPVVVAEEAIADRLVRMLAEQASKLRLGAAWEKSTDLGPVVNAGHLKFVTDWIATGVREGAKLVLDGRNPKVPRGLEGGSFIGPTIFDHVTGDMSVGREEIFGPVLCVKRVKGFEEGLRIMNASRFGNGSVIYTESGHYADVFAARTDAGMVGVNVGIPVPLGIFGFTGHKQSFFGDLHMMGTDGFKFYTDSTVVTQTWFGKERTGQKRGRPEKVDTWDGTMAVSKG